MNTKKILSIAVICILVLLAVITLFLSFYVVKEGQIRHSKTIR